MQGGGLSPEKGLEGRPSRVLGARTGQQKQKLALQGSGAGQQRHGLIPKGLGDPAWTAETGADPEGNWGLIWTAEAGADPAGTGDLPRTA